MTPAEGQSGYTEAYTFTTGPLNLPPTGEAQPMGLSRAAFRCPQVALLRHCALLSVSTLPTASELDYASSLEVLSRLEFRNAIVCVDLMHQK